MDEEEEWKVEKILNKRKNKRSNKVFSTIEGIYSRKWHMGERKRLRKCKGSSGRIWKKTECRSKMKGKVEYSRERRL